MMRASDSFSARIYRAFCLALAEKLKNTTNELFAVRKQMSQAS